MVGLGGKIAPALPTALPLRTFERIIESVTGKVLVAKKERDRT